MSLDAKEDFERDPQRVALIPFGERVEAVIRATSEGRVAAHSVGPEMTLGAAGALVGAAARKLSKTNEPEMVGGIAARWPGEASLYWIVLTDRALHVVVADEGPSNVTGSSGAAFAHDEVERLEVGQSFVIKPMKFVFTDGSAVTVDCAGGIKTDDFMEAAGRAFSSGVTRGLKNTSGFWVWAWLGIFGLMLGALATGVGATTEGGTTAVVLSVIAVVCALLATWWWLARWRSRGVEAVGGGPRPVDRRIDPDRGLFRQGVVRLRRNDLAGGAVRGGRARCPRGPGITTVVSAPGGLRTPTPLRAVPPARWAWACASCTGPLVQDRSRGLGRPRDEPLDHDGGEAERPPGRPEARPGADSPGEARPGGVPVKLVDALAGHLVHQLRIHVALLSQRRIRWDHARGRGATAHRAEGRDR